jgi:hypothetical protein
LLGLTAANEIVAFAAVGGIVRVALVPAMPGFSSLSWRWAALLLPKYFGTLVPMSESDGLLVERVQTGVRIEKRLLKVLKAFAEYHDLTLGDLLEGIVLHAFDGKTPFSQRSLDQIKKLKQFYGLELDASASHRLKATKRRQSLRRRNS